MGPMADLDNAMEQLDNVMDTVDELIRELPISKDKQLELINKVYDFWSEVELAIDET